MYKECPKVMFIVNKNGNESSVQATGNIVIEDMSIVMAPKIIKSLDDIYDS